ncbi:hypothetical protein GC177_08970 [bacterium]|nr:hypothetical protein [bacterium]
MTAEHPDPSQAPQPDLQSEERKLADLKHWLDAKTEGQTEQGPNPATQPGQAWRVATELFGGVVVGTVLGIALDRWLGTTPWFLLTCFMFGVAGSGLTIYRSSK